MIESDTRNGGRYVDLLLKRYYVCCISPLISKYRVQIDIFPRFGRINDLAAAKIVARPQRKAAGHD